jgi:hypothetical protein
MPQTGFPTIRFTSNGTQHFKISSFEYSTSPDKLGAECKVTLANPHSQPLDIRGDFLLELLWGATPTDRDSIALISDGRLLSRSNGYAMTGTPPRPADSQSLKAIDRIGDRWSIRPTIPYMLYDPNKYNPATQSSELHGDVRDFNNNPIFADYISVPGLDLYYLLNWVYVTQCGFPAVVTNIETFPIRYCGFDLRNSFHDDVKKEVALFAPIYFVDEAGALNIIDINAPQPVGTQPQNVHATQYKSAQVEIPYSQLITAILLTYMEDVNETELDIPSNATTVVTPDINTIGTPGQPGYHQTLRRVTTVQFHDDPSDPIRITRTVDKQIEEVTLATVTNNGTMTVQMIKQETQVDNFVPGQNFRVPAGYTKTTGLLLALPEGTANTDGSLGLQFIPSAFVETMEIDWAASQYTPDVWIQTFKRKSVSGYAWIDGTDPAQPNVLKLPLSDAYNQSLIKQDGSQISLSGIPLETEVWHIRETGAGSDAGYVEIKVDGVNQLTGATSKSDTYSGVGSSMVTIARWRSLTTIIRNLTAEGDPEIGPRKPDAVNCGEVPYQIALPIVIRRLNRFSSPAYTINVDMNMLDLNISKGAIRCVFDSQGNALKDDQGNVINWIVTAFKVSGSAPNVDGSWRYNMNWSGVQLLNDADISWTVG